ncbi:amino acid adenylation domain-containing protein [Streptomyces sp. NPDC060232]|uniref:amino acid adenylation domain-containing protein n=1 Tax=Streptomyces sp. NPDC060232 TaxID=3347079 RepID=UPI0036498BD8
MSREAAFSCHLIGENTLLVTCAELLMERGHRILSVVSPTPEVRDWAREQGLPARDFGPDLEAHLSARPFDHLFSIANLRMLPAPVLALPRGLAVNFHDALLPDHAGVHAATWALLAGERRHGITWHVMTEGADEGDVLVQRSFEVAADETGHSLDVKCFDAGVEAFAELVDALAGDRVVRRPQDLAARSYHGRLDRPSDAGLLSWHAPAAALGRTVRARDFGVHPNTFGSAKMLLDGKVLLVGALEERAEHSGRPPGTVLSADAEAAVVATETGDVRLTRLTTVTGEPLVPADVLRPGTVLPVPDTATVAAVHGAERALLRHEGHWVRRLDRLAPAVLPGADPAGPAAVAPPAVHTVPVPAGLPSASAAVPRERWLLAAFLAYIARICGEDGVDVDLRLPGPVAEGPLPPAVRALRSPFVPFHVPSLSEGPSMAAWCARIADGLSETERRGSFARDVWARHPELARQRFLADGLPIAVEITDEPASEPSLRAGTALLVRIPRTSGDCTWAVAGGADATGTAAAAARHAAAFLEAVAGPAGADLAGAPVCSDEDLRRTLIQWNDTDTEAGTSSGFGTDAGLGPRTRVDRLVAEQARRRPAAPAVTDRNETLDYAGLDRSAEDLADRLRGRGIGPGDLVGIYLNRSVALPAALLAVMKTGAAYVPLDPIYPAERIAYMLADTGLPLVVTETALAGRLPAGDAEVLLLDEPPPAAAPAPVHRPPSRAAGGDDLAYVIYTSGSTGRPKGVRVGHRALSNFLTSMVRTPGLTERDRLLAVTTVCFDIAGLELYAPLISGAEVEIADDDTAADGFRLRALIEERRPTVMQATPATWRMLVEAGWGGGPGLKVLCGGEALPRDLADALVARAGSVWNLYGPTETTIWSSVARVLPGRPVTIGRPVDNTRLYVLDARLRPVAPGLPGELYIGGDGVADGYLGRPDLTAQRFVRDVFDPAAGRLYRTGDLVRHLPDGELEYLDRVDRQVKLHGYRIEPGEIEEALRAHPAVEQAAVLVREDTPGVRRLVAYLVTGGGGPAVSELRSALGSTLPAYMVPSAFVALDRLPRTANGKIDRGALPAPGAAAAAPAGAARPAAGTERVIAGAWSAVLGVESVGADDNFFEVGGNSLLLMRVMGRLVQELGRPLTRVEMFKYPTVRSMARHLAARDAAAAGGGAAPVRDRAAVRGRARGRAALGALRTRRGQRTADRQPPRP